MFFDGKYFCSLCGHGDTDRRVLLRLGETEVTVCNECLRPADEIIAREQERRAVPPTCILVGGNERVIAFFARKPVPAPTSGVTAPSSA